MNQLIFLAPNGCGPDFAQSGLDVGFKPWKDVSIFKIQDLCIGGL